jgi:hypothetical protein
MFKEKVMCAFKGLRRVKSCWNIVIAKTEKKCLLENPNSYKALTSLAPMSNMVATTTSPALWQASKNPFKKITSVSHLVLPRIK